MAELVDWLHYESITRAGTNTASSYIRQDHHLPHGSLEPHITNADRIRAMSDEELARFFTTSEAFDAFECPVPKACSYFDNCRECFLEWLKKEVDDGKGKEED